LFGLTIFSGLKDLLIDVVAVLAIIKNANQSETEEYVAANTASYAKELIRGIIADDFVNSISTLRGTETIIPPHTKG
jgi:hypothetical protein